MRHPSVVDKTALRCQTAPRRDLNPTKRPYVQPFECAYCGTYDPIEEHTPPGPRVEDEEDADEDGDIEEQFDNGGASADDEEPEGDNKVEYWRTGWGAVAASA